MASTSEIDLVFKNAIKKRKAPATKEPPKKKVKIELLFTNNLNNIPLKEKKGLPDYVPSEVRLFLGSSKFTMPRNWSERAPVFIVKFAKQMPLKTVNKIVFTQEEDPCQIVMLAIFLYSMLPTEGFMKLYLYGGLKNQMKSFSLGLVLLQRCFLIPFTSVE